MIGRLERNLKSASNWTDTTGLVLESDEVGGFLLVNPDTGSIWLEMDPEGAVLANSGFTELFQVDEVAKKAHRERLQTYGFLEQVEKLDAVGLDAALVTVRGDIEREWESSMRTVNYMGKKEGKKTPVYHTHQRLLYVLLAVKAEREGEKALVTVGGAIHGWGRIDSARSVLGLPPR